MATKKKPIHYIDNVKFTGEVIKYATAYRASKAADLLPDRMNDYLGAAILKMAQKIATRPNFSGYSYRNDLISDGIINVVQYLHNFDAEKSTNAFGYCSQIIWFGFLRTINKEKKIFLTKQKYISHVGVMDKTDTQQNGDDRQYITAFQEMFKSFADQTDFPDEKKSKKNSKKPTVPKNLENFYEQQHNDITPG